MRLLIANLFICTAAPPPQVYSNVYHVHLLCLFNNGEDDGEKKERKKTKHIMWLLCMCTNLQMRTHLYVYWRVC